MQQHCGKIGPSIVVVFVVILLLLLLLLLSSISSHPLSPDFHLFDFQKLNITYLKLMPNSNGSVARFENETTLRKNEAKPQKNGILRDNSTNKQVNCADPSDDKWLSFYVFPTLYVAPTWKNGRV